MGKNNIANYYIELEILYSKLINCINPKKKASLRLNCQIRTPSHKIYAS